MIHFISYQQLARDTLKLVPWCIERDVSAIYGAPRSGMLPATMLAAALQAVLGVAGGEAGGGRRLVGHVRAGSGPALLIEDSVNSGTGLKVAKAMMTSPFCTASAFLTACVYTKPDSVGLVDKVARVLDGARFFEWNIFNCDAGQHFMWDLDGVFLRDPPPEDGDLYEYYIRTAQPLYPTMWPVGWICTNRIEHWRRATEEWLASQRISVKHGLFMQPHATAAARRANSTPGEFKAYCYQQAGTACWLFVESHDVIAADIFERTGRPVLSLQSMRIYQ